MGLILEEISKTSIKLLLNEPFYGHFFTGIVKEVSDRVNTAAVGMVNPQMVKLMVNPEFWESLEKPEHRYGLIKHEVLHIVLKHLTKQKEFSHKYLYNIAADLVVNQYINEEQLPEGGITLQRFWYIEEKYNIKLKPNQDVGYYYHKLKKLIDKNTITSANECNSEEGNLEGKPSPIMLDDLLKDDHPELEKHKFWKSVEELSDAEQKIMERYVNDIIKQTVNRIKYKGKGIGHLPLGLQEYLNELLESLKPNLDWRRVLRLFAASSSRTFLKTTIQRPSKRYGTTPGIKVKRKQKLLVAIDTSGSVSIPELQDFFSEIYHIWRQGAEIYIVECDTHIHQQYLYRGKPPEIISGRGGTAFDEPILFANEQYNPDAIIYFTDGFAAAPSIKSRCSILWLISSQGLKEDDSSWVTLPGRKVKMATR
ncbi:VWA-like domain-containing protein [Limibacter armeniacum]|uniref:vWA domain-containing protein n=1 Tax=Limibacter armeniacum TaxID=466084 RepID=UPI002FE63449